MLPNLLLMLKQYDCNILKFTPAKGITLIPGDYFISAEVTNGTVVYQSNYVEETN